MPCDQRPVTLLELLSNSLVLRQTVPYLPVSGLLSLSTSCKSFRDLLFKTPGVFRYVDLSTVKGAAIPLGSIDVGGEIWRAERMDEALTEDDFYAGPLRGVFSNLRRKNILGDVQTLILDGLAVPADLIWEIVGFSDYNVRLLSIREVKNLNEKKLMQILRHCVRPSRPMGTPKLQGLYVFGPKDRGHLLPTGRTSDGLGVKRTGVMSSEGAQLGMELNHKPHNTMSSAEEDKWYESCGRMLPKAPIREWAETVAACEGLIAFDAVLCRGPRHSIPSPSADTDDPVLVDLGELLETRFLPPAIATVALGPNGCAVCHTSPEAPLIYGGRSQAALPLLAPPPLHSYNCRIAQRPSSATTTPAKLFARCAVCLADRWCERCNKWWCERCFKNSDFEPFTTLQKIEAPLDVIAAGYIDGQGSQDIKVHLGLCTEGCLVSELMAGAGEGGMWG